MSTEELFLGMLQKVEHAYKTDSAFLRESQSIYTALQTVAKSIRTSGEQVPQQLEYAITSENVRVGAYNGKIDAYSYMLSTLRDAFMEYKEGNMQTVNAEEENPELPW